MIQKDVWNEAVSIGIAMAVLSPDYVCKGMMRVVTIHRTLDVDTSAEESIKIAVRKGGQAHSKTYLGQLNKYTDDTSPII